jgi:hypothetical protein
LDKNGDYAGGQSISNIQLQMGDPIARYATGNGTSTGNQKSVAGQLGSNILIGNEFGALLDGGGVGGGANGTGIGFDSLVGHATGGYSNSSADTFMLAGYYTGSTQSVKATVVTTVGTGPTGNGIAVNLTEINSVSAKATDLDYAVVDVTGSSLDPQNYQGLLNLGGTSGYLIGSAPTGFANNNITGTGLTGNTATDAQLKDFGIYKITGDHPNLVAEVKGIALGGNLNFYTTQGLTADGISDPRFTPPDITTPSSHMGGNSGYYNSTQLPIAEGFAGMGVFYQLSGSNFGAYHVI